MKKYLLGAILGTVMFLTAPAVADAITYVDQPTGSVCYLEISY